MIHPSLEKLDLPEEDREIVLSTGSLQGTSFAQKHPEIAKLYLIAPEISPEWHLIVQASWQKWIDSSISKTINLPSTATVDEIKKTYLKANELGMKGITIYRSGTLESEPIKVGARETEGDDQTMIEQLPDGNQVEGKTYEAGCKDGICSL
jgi:ribonucleoside-diphosphate reductase alpha chain